MRNVLFSMVLITSVLGTHDQMAQAQTGEGDLLKVLQQIDDRQRTSGDFRSVVVMQQREGGKSDMAYEAVVLRRRESQQFILLFSRPKSHKGQGYLRLKDNLWFYDSNLGKWERRSERERLSGTNSRREDLDESRLAETYLPQASGEEKLGAALAQVLTLKVRPGKEVAFPLIKVWVDKASGNVIKRQDFALSGRLLRTSLLSQWKKVHSDAKGGDVWYPAETRIQDELDKGNSTLLAVRSISLTPLEENVFTKAWLESKAR